MVLFKRHWEHWTRSERQAALAGITPREEYLETRRQAVVELVRLLSIDPSSVGFEIGSGEGVVARDLAQQCQSIDCTDISRTFLKLARKTCRGSTNIRFSRIRKNHLDFLPAEHYDFGYALNVFIHLNQYEIFFYFKSIRRILKPTGAFFFTGSTLGVDTIDLFRFFAKRYKKLGETRPGFMRWANLEILESLANEAGLVVDHDRLWSSGGHLKIVLRPKLD